jgi:hypothetical protein
VNPVFGLGREASIVHGEPEEIATCLKNIQLLWNLGRRPAREHLRDQRGKRSERPPEHADWPMQQKEQRDDDNEIPF